MIDISSNIYQVQSSQVILSHTVVRSFAHKYADDPVLVLGGINDAIRKVAEECVFLTP